MFCPSCMRLLHEKAEYTLNFTVSHMIQSMDTFDVCVFVILCSDDAIRDALSSRHGRGLRDTKRWIPRPWRFARVISVSESTHRNLLNCSRVLCEVL